MHFKPGIRKKVQLSWPQTHETLFFFDFDVLQNSNKPQGKQFETHDFILTTFMLLYVCNTNIFLQIWMEIKLRRMRILQQLTLTMATKKKRKISLSMIKFPTISNTAFLRIFFLFCRLPDTMKIDRSLIGDEVFQKKTVSFINNYLWLFWSFLMYLFYVDLRW